MIAVGIILAVLLLIAFLRVGVTAEYAEDGFVVTASVGFVQFQVYPSLKAKKGRKVVRKKAGKKNAADTAKKAGRLEMLKGQLPSINQMLARLKRKLLIAELTIYYMAAGEDPAAAALYFGGVSAGYGILIPLLENNFKVRKSDFRTTVSFEAKEPYIYVRARLSLAVWELIYAGFGFVKKLVKSDTMKAKLGKAV